MVRVNNKGQALVEFVLILPVMVLILLAIVDFGNVLFSKNKLENDSTDIVRMISNNDISKIDDLYPNIDVNIEDYKEEYKKVVLSTNVKINTPLIDKILGNPCKITTERVILDE